MSSSPRFLRVAGLNYESLKKAIYSENVGLAGKSYDQQQQFIFNQFYTYGDSISNGMKKLGYDAHEIIFDLEILQKKWALENGFLYQNENWQEQILLDQIDTLRPEVIYFQDIQAFSKKTFFALKQRFPFIKRFIIFRGYPGVNQSLFQILAKADVLLVGSPILLKKCTDAGLKPHLMYHFFDERILLNTLNSRAESSFPFTFVGSSGYGHGLNHQPRYAALIKLLELTDLHVWIEEECRATTFSSNARHYAMSFFANLPLSILNYLALAVKDNLSLCNIIDRAIKYKKVSSKKLLPLKPLSRVFPFKCHKPLFGVSMYELLAKSKVSFNIHACAAADTVDNMRLFQATGMGSCLLTDYGVNIRDLFIPDIEVVTYSSLDECIEKAEYLLRNEKVRSEIALRGQKRTLESHTAIQRCNQIDALIKS